MKNKPEPLASLWMGGFDPTKLFSPDAALSHFTESMEQGWRAMDASTEWMRSFFPDASKNWFAEWPGMSMDWERQVAELWKMMGIDLNAVKDGGQKEIDALKAELERLSAQMASVQKNAESHADKAMKAEKSLKAAERKIKDLEARLKAAEAAPKGGTAKKKSDGKDTKIE